MTFDEMQLTAIASDRTVVLNTLLHEPKIDSQKRSDQSRVF